MIINAGRWAENRAEIDVPLCGSSAPLAQNSRGARRSASCGTDQAQNGECVRARVYWKEGEGKATGNGNGNDKRKNCMREGRWSGEMTQDRQKAGDMEGKGVEIQQTTRRCVTTCVELPRKRAKELEVNGRGRGKRSGTRGGARSLSTRTPSRPNGDTTLRHDDCGRGAVFAPRPNAAKGTSTRVNGMGPRERREEEEADSWDCTGLVRLPVTLVRNPREAPRSLPSAAAACARALTRERDGLGPWGCLHLSPDSLSCTASTPARGSFESHVFIVLSCVGGGRGRRRTVGSHSRARARWRNEARRGETEQREESRIRSNANTTVRDKRGLEGGNGGNDNGWMQIHGHVPRSRRRRGLGGRGILEGACVWRRLHADVRKTAWRRVEAAGGALAADEEPYSSDVHQFQGGLGRREKARDEYNWREKTASARAVETQDRATIAWRDGGEPRARSRTRDADTNAACAQRTHTDAGGGRQDTKQTDTKGEQDARHHRATPHASTAHGTRRSITTGDAPAHTPESSLDSGPLHRGHLRARDILSGQTARFAVLLGRGGGELRVMARSGTSVSSSEGRRAVGRHRRARRKKGQERSWSHDVTAHHDAFGCQRSESRGISQYSTLSLNYIRARLIG
ncbi:hypothetical protein DFH09DRAFT_1502280 [Mycena vulgaris]|nr:hypothetical protein DFH09DRAFT_1502280 [Mycena vulgaris]